MAAVSDVTRKAVWDTLCDLEWQMRYYRAMADRRQRIHRWVRLALLVSIAVEVASSTEEQYTLGCFT